MEDNGGEGKASLVFEESDDSLKLSEECFYFLQRKRQSNDLILAELLEISGQELKCDRHFTLLVQLTRLHPYHIQWHVVKLVVLLVGLLLLTICILHSNCLSISFSL